VSEAVAMAGMVHLELQQALQIQAVVVVEAALT
jgi:hypothetical protein